MTDTLNEDLWTFMAICRWVVLKMRSIPDKTVEIIKTHILCSVTFFSKIVPFMR